MHQFRNIWIPTALEEPPLCLREKDNHPILLRVVASGEFVFLYRGFNFLIVIQ